MKILYDNINNYTNKNYKYFLSILSKKDKIKLNKLLKINDKKLFILSRVLLNKLIKENYNTKYNNVNIFYNQFNKPLTNNFYFNISHKEEYCIVAISTKKIGIDIEKIKQVDIKTINYFCTDTEKEYILNSTNKYKSLFEIYCLKEAYIKMLGNGLSNIKNIEFKINNNKFICSNNTNIQITLKYDIDNYIVAIIEEN
jgi:4'-phosphopantetheinyl transferase